MTKRGTAFLSYAEDAYDDDDFEDSDRPRRATGLRSVQKADPSSADHSAQIADGLHPLGLRRRRPVRSLEGQLMRREASALLLATAGVLTILTALLLARLDPRQRADER